MQAEQHDLLVGTNIVSEQNYLIMASVNLPREDAIIDNRTKTKDVANNDNNKEAPGSSRSSSRSSSSKHQEDSSSSSSFAVSKA
mmetsp:Transcript_7821/g.13778  ORF Transcript_7821/g.13778 Transcript_7821/m.13778 type:complete len:84 (-) Transcript_7821:66-317(-)